MKYQDYYDILGVDKTADASAIRKAYRGLAKKYHPDTNPGNKAAEDKFKEISEAYEVLSDPDKKKKYDQLGQGYQDLGGGEFDPGAFGFGGYTFHEGTGNYSDFFNMFFGEDLFGRFDGESRGQTSKGMDVTAALTIDLEEAYSGCKKTFTLQGGPSQSQLTVRIPPGVLEGDKIRLKGKGNPSPYHKDAGDLILTLHIRPPYGVRLEGLNLYEPLEIYPWEAYLGCQKSIKTLSGDTLVTIPEGMANGQKIRLKDKGFKDRKGNRGNLILEVMYKNPPKGDDRIKEAYRALKDLIHRR